MERENAGFAGRTEVETVVETTELIVRQESCQNPHPASPRGRGDKRAYSREGVERFLAAVMEHVALLERARAGVLEGYERSCQEQVRVRTVVKENYVKLEVVMRPGKPGKQYLALARQIEAELKQLRKSLGWEPRGNR
ncbi:MAG: hypothetical protein ACR2FY_12785 [Pirellulaceae bacterium]